MSTFGKSNIGFVSHPKVGRTWVRMMLLKYYSLLKGSKPKKTKIETILKGSGLPYIIFSHDNTTIFKTAQGTVKQKLVDYKNKPIIYMVRDPRDTVVSWYFYIERNVSFFEFLREKKTNFERLCQHFYIWDKSIATNLLNVNVIYYEDFHKNPNQEFYNLLMWIKKSIRARKFPRFIVKKDFIEKSVEYASFSNMHEMEKKGTFEGWSALYRNPEKRGPEQFKTRKGKIGGYKDYLNRTEINFCNKMMMEYSCSLTKRYL